MTGSSAERADAVLATMREAGAAGERSRVVALAQMEGGWSRHTYGLTVADPDRGEHEYVVRVRPGDSVLDTDLGQEFRLFELLHEEAAVPVPAVHGYEPAEDTPFGGPFFVMDRIPGDAMNVWRRRDREAMQRNWEDSRSIAQDFVGALAAIHGADPERVRSVAVARDFRATVEHWRGIYEDVKLVRDPVVEEAFAWVLDNEPDPVPPTLVHGDYRIGNCLLDGGRLSGVLDWELASIGDRRFDLGYMSLDYSAGRFVAPGSPLLGGVAGREWFDQRYEQLTGFPVDRAVVDVFAVLGGLMLFAIMGTGIRLFARGETRDIRTAWSRFVFPGLRRDIATLVGW